MFLSCSRCLTSGFDLVTGAGVGFALFVPLLYSFFLGGMDVRGSSASIMGSMSSVKYVCDVSSLVRGK